MTKISKEAIEAARSEFFRTYTAGTPMSVVMEATLKAAAPFITQGYYEECTKLRPVIETLSKENTRLKKIIDQQQRDARTGIRSW